MPASDKVYTQQAHVTVRLQRRTATLEDKLHPHAAITDEQAAHVAPPLARVDCRTQLLLQRGKVGDAGQVQP